MGIHTFWLTGFIMSYVFGELFLRNNPNATKTILWLTRGTYAVILSIYAWNWWL